MKTKVLELTEKIYKEGVEKAKQEASEIISKAKQEAIKEQKKNKSISMDIYGRL